ncbi:hypothetical protein [Streptomyces apocyni]|uniref:hypothetical protein n=1 Tax=Streptomyces apocyni TaxID=2654677 RepID=UPI0012EA7498|nr:hypothetical protein [Streptomyces apocyni]
MRIRTALATAASAALLLALPVGTAAAATPVADPKPAAQQGEPCGDLKLSGELPAPPPGMAVQQQVTIGEDCAPKLGPVKYVPSSSSAPTTRKASLSTAAATSSTSSASSTTGQHQLRSWNEMYDCCNIRMTGLYTTSTWETDDTRVTTASTEARQEWNREPWNAGWSLKSSASTDDCTTDCTTSRSDSTADFTYKGIFDITGNRYANTHHSSIELKPDGTASCTFDVDLRNTFIGWNWQRGCE